MGPPMHQLNAEQRQAVRLIDRPLLVLAGAGSGKTSVITQKIAYLIDECGLRATHIAALTFTNKAAREMKERVGRLLSRKAARGLTVSTFHTLGLTIVRKHCQALSLSSGFTLFDQQDARAVIKDSLLRDWPNQAEQVDFVQQRISLWKNALLDPVVAQQQAVDEATQMAAQVFAQYNRLLSAYNAVDFDDLIRLPAQLFRDNPEVLQHWQQRLRYLLVDEYQDTNLSQYALVKYLVGARERFTVVGDDDQSIYAWRGARPENIAQLQADYPQLQVVKLEQNYRSTNRILRAANQLISHNPHVFSKQLWSQQGLGEPIQIVQTLSEDDEAQRITTEIVHQHLQFKRPYKDFAVLYRSNHQARLLEIKLQQHQVPYKLSGGTSFFARAEIKDIMSYLRLMMNPDDDAALLRIINTPRREIGAATLEKLNAYARERGVSLLQACGELGLQQHLSATQVQRVQRFAQWVEYTAKQLATDEQPMRILHELLDDIDYEAFLFQDSQSPGQAERRWGNVQQLLSSVQRMLEPAEEGDDDNSVQDAIAKLVLRDILERQEEEDDSDRVQLMTLHAAKGLEFPCVFMMGLEEDLLPHRNSIENGDIEEERRLMYVGMTRAQTHLTLTYTAKRRQFGENQPSTPSRFLDELPQEDVHWQGRSDADPKLSHQKAVQALAGLKSLFD